MTKPYAKIQGVILSGGSSRRFGSDKAVTMLDGRPLIEHVYHVLTSAAHSTVISVQESGRTYPVDAEYVVDEWKDSGPLSGIASAFRATKAESMFVVAADLPRVSRETLQRIAGDFQEPVTVARNADTNRIQPLCAIWHRGVLDELCRYIDDGGRAVMGFLDKVGYHTVDVPPGSLVNINRPEDLHPSNRRE